MTNTGSRIPDGRPSRKGRRQRGRWITAAVAVAVLGLGGAFATQLRPTPLFEGGHLLGKPVPSFDLPTVDGSGVSSRGLRGKAYIVNFWNTWCIPCRQEHPALVEFYRRHASDPDFSMVGIVREDTNAAVRRYVAEENIGWTIAFDPGARASVDFATSGQPETYAISPDGVVVGSNIGPSTVSDLEAMLSHARGIT